MTEKICTHGHNHHQHCVDFEQNASKSLIVIIILFLSVKDKIESFENKIEKSGKILYN